MQTQRKEIERLQIGQHGPELDRAEHVKEKIEVRDSSPITIKKGRI